MADGGEADHASYDYPSLLGPIRKPRAVIRRGERHSRLLTRTLIGRMAGTEQSQLTNRRSQLQEGLKDRRAQMRAIAVVALFGFTASTMPAANIVTQHNNRERTGTNLHETVLTPANVNVEQFGMLFHHVVDDQVYGQPLIVTNVRIGGGTHDVVYITTVNNSVYAFDANDDEASGPLWHVNFGTPPNVNDGNFECLDMNGNMGIAGTPVIDLNTGILYVVADTRLRDDFVQRLHALD